MYLNFIVFPIPTSSYSVGAQSAEIFWIPKGNLAAINREKTLKQQSDSDRFTASRSKNFGSLSSSFKQETAKQNQTKETSFEQTCEFQNTNQICDECNEQDDETFSYNGDHSHPSSITNYSFGVSLSKTISTKRSEIKSPLRVENKKTEQSISHQHSKSLLSSQKTPQIKDQINCNQDYLPCIYLRAGIQSPNFMIYFHGNGEDANLSFDLLSHLRNNLDVNLISMEYPGYGVYKQFDTNIDKAELILRDAEYLYDYLTNVIGVEEKRIIIFGRSIGTGPASHLASKRNPGALLLISPFKSLRELATDMVGKFLSGILKERFNNLENIQNVKCPTFILHGQADELISYKHSLAIFGKQIFFNIELTCFKIIKKSVVDLVKWFCLSI